MHAWNINTFKQIGNACGGFLEVARCTWRKLDLIDATIKVKDNFCGFIPTFVIFTDDEGAQFTIQTVVPMIGKWLVCRNPKIHGSFTREAARNFDEFDDSTESFTFRGNSACLANHVSASVRKIINNASTSDVLAPKQTNVSASNQKDKGKQVCTDTEVIITQPKNVTFPSPKNKTIFYNPTYAPARKLSSLGPTHFEKPKQFKSKEIYRPKSYSGIKIAEPVQEKANPSDSAGLVYQSLNGEKFTLSVDLGSLSPISDVVVSSPDNTPSLSPKAHITSEPPSAIINESLKFLISSDNADEDREDNIQGTKEHEADFEEDSPGEESHDMNEEGKKKDEKEDDGFKKKLNDWLSENDFFIVPTKFVSGIFCKGSNSDDHVTSHLALGNSVSPRRSFLGMLKG